MIKKYGITFIILLLGGLAYMGQEHLHEKSSSVLRVAFPSLNRPLNYEPTAIHLAYEYFFLENIYSPIVEIDPKDGSIRSGIAKEMSWVGDHLYLKIRDDLKTASGKSITASDVVFSLKRLLVLSGNTHGNFGDLICPGVALTSVEQECPGILLDGNTVILKSQGRKSFLLPMLGAIDFAIIPRTSVEPTTLKIIDYKETSGPYYIADYYKDGSAKLKINPHHYHASDEIAQEIKLIAFERTIPQGGLQLLKEGKVDHVMTANSASTEDLLLYAKEHEDDINTHVTMTIRNTLLTFTDRGLKELTVEKRQKIGQTIRASFAKVYSSKMGYQVSHEFFAPTADGGLGERQAQIIQKYSEASDPILEKFNLTFIKSGDAGLWEEAVKDAVPNAVFKKDIRLPDLTVYENGDEKPHAFIATTDSGYFEDINLISYSLNVGFFGLTKDQKKEWLVKYMSIENKEERLRLLSELHFEALDRVVLVPLVIAPFVALSTKEWKMELSQLFANNQLWLLKRQ